VTAYLTPERFRTMGHGADLSSMSDLTVAEYLEDAASVTNAYCTVPYGHSFLGGVVVAEQRPWRFPSTPAINDPGSRRIFPKHWPITTVQDLRIVVAAGSSASMPVDTLVIDRSRRFVEITAATLVNTSGLFGVTGWIVPFGGMQQPIAEIDYTYGAFLEAEDRLYPVGDSDVIYQAPQGFWHDDVVGEAELEVTVGGTVMAAVDPGPITNWTADREEGRIIFEVAPPGIVRAHYWHKLYPEIPRANAIIAADLIGHSKLVSKGMSGLQGITVGEIRIQKETVRQALGAALDTTLPRAAELLQGFKYWSAA
jgi:hypothetical protein